MVVPVNSSVEFDDVNPPVANAKVDVPQDASENLAVPIVGLVYQAVPSHPSVTPVGPSPP